LAWRKGGGASWKTQKEIEEHEKIQKVLTRRKKSGKIEKGFGSDKAYIGQTALGSEGT